MQRYIERASGNVIHAHRFRASLADGYKVIRRERDKGAFPIYVPKHCWKDEHHNEYIILGYFIRDGDKVYEAFDTDWIIFKDEKKYVINEDVFYNEYIQQC